MTDSTDTTEAIEIKDAEMTAPKKRLLYTATAIVSFVFFLVILFPTQQISQNILAMVAQQTNTYMEANVTSIGFFPFPHLYAEKLKVYPLNSYTMKFKQLHIDSISIYPSFLKMIPIPGVRTFSPAASFSAKIFQGSVSGSVSLGNRYQINADIKNVSINEIQQVFLESNRDWKGEIQSLQFDFEIPGSRVSQMNGKINGTLSNVHIDLSAFELPWPGLSMMNLGKAVINADVERGTAKIKQLQLGTTKSDLDASISGEVRLNRMIALSRMSLEVSYNLNGQLNQQFGPLAQTILKPSRKAGKNCFKISGSASPIPSFGPC